VVTLRGGYKVNMCVERVEDGEALVTEAQDYGLDSEQSALLYFFDRDNAEVLVKVLDGCAINGHRWVFVAPVTDVAFNLYVTDGEGDPWLHRNRQGEVATPRRDTFAFRCRE
jgi:hypothetical protein